MNKTSFVIYVVTSVANKDAHISTAGVITLDRLNLTPIIDCNSPEEQFHVWLIAIYEDLEKTRKTYQAILDSDAYTPAEIATFVIQYERKI